MGVVWEKVGEVKGMLSKLDKNVKIWSANIAILDSGHSQQRCTCKHSDKIFPQGRFVLSDSVSLSFARSLSLIHIHASTHTHMHAHSCTFSHTHAYTFTHACTHAYPMHTSTQCTHAHMHTLAYMCTHTCTQCMHTHAHTLIFLQQIITYLETRKAVFQPTCLRIIFDFSFYHIKLEIWS